MLQMTFNERTPERLKSVNFKYLILRFILILDFVMYIKINEMVIPKYLHLIT